MSITANPEVGQTQDDFIKEELSKTKTTIQTWVKEIAPKAITSGAWPLDRIKDWAVYNQVKSIVESNESTVTNKESDANMDVAEKKLEKEENVEEPVDKVDMDMNSIEVVKGVEKQEKSLITKTIYQDVVFSDPIPFTNTETSFYKIYAIGLPQEKEFVVKLEGLPQIQPFSVGKEFVQNLQKLLDSLEQWLKIIYAQTESVDERHNYWEHTISSQMGINFTQEVINLVNHRTNITEMMTNVVFPKESAELKVRKNYVGAQDPISEKLEELANLRYPVQEYIDSTPRKVEDIRAFFSDMLSRRGVVLKPLPDDFLPKFSLINYDYPDAGVFTSLIPNSPVLRDFIWKRMKSLAATRVITQQFDTLPRFEDFLQQINASATTFTKGATIPASLTKARSDRMAMKLIQCAPNGGLVRLNYTFGDHYDASPAQMLDCMLAPLIIPNYLFDHQTRLEFANYFAWSYVLPMRTVKQMVTYQRYDRNFDYLAELWRRAKGKLKRFISNARTYFSGMSNSGRLAQVRCTSSANRMLCRKILMTYPYGKFIHQYDDSYDAIALFNAMVSFLNDDKLYDYNTNKSIMRSVVAMLLKAQARREQIAQNASKITSYVQVLSASPYCYPITSGIFAQHDKHRTPEAPLAPRNIVEVAAWEISSYVYLASFHEEEPHAITLDQVLSAQNLFGYVHELAERYSYSKKYFTKERYPFLSKHHKLFVKKDHLDYAFAGGRYKAPSDLHTPLFFEFLKHSGYGRKLPEIPLSSRKLQVRAALHELVMSQPELFGFTLGVFVNNKYQQVINAQGMRAIVTSSAINLETQQTRKIEVYSYDRIALELAMEKFGKNIHDHYNNGRIIYFKFPFPITYKKYFIETGVVQDGQIPITVTDSGVKLKPVTILYDQLQDYRYVHIYDPKIVKFPEILTRRKAIAPDGKPEDIIRKVIRMKKRYTHNVKVYTLKDLFIPYTTNLFE